MNYERIDTLDIYWQMSESQSSNCDSTQQQQPQQPQTYQDSNIYSSETEQIYLKMKEAWL